jgi:hypothetical protein
MLSKYKRSEDILFPARRPVDPAVQEGSDEATPVSIQAFRTLKHKHGLRAQYLTKWKDGSELWNNWKDFVDFEDHTINQVFLDYLLSNPTHTVPKLTEYLKEHQEVNLESLPVVSPSSNQASPSSDNDYISSSSDNSSTSSSSDRIDDSSSSQTISSSSSQPPGDALGLPRRISRRKRVRK